MHINKLAISLGFCALTAFATPAAVVNKAALVNLRIEGANKTHFEGFVLTKGHNITTALGGNHHCDGTNNHTNPHPGPTPNAALDDAAKKARFSFDGYVKICNLINKLHTTRILTDWSCHFLLFPIPQSIFLRI